MDSLDKFLLPFVDTQLFKIGGKPCKFSIRNTYPPSNTFANLLKENCSNLIRMCGGAVLALDGRSKISDKRICLVMGDESHGQSFAEMREKMKCDLFTLDFLWHSVFAQKRMHLDKYLLHPLAFPLTQAIVGTDSNGELYSANDIMNPVSEITWKAVRLRYRNTSQHPGECGDRDGYQCPCFADPSLSGGDSEDENPDVPVDTEPGFSHPEMFQIRKGCASFLLLLDEAQERDECCIKIRDAMHQLIMAYGGQITSTSTSNYKQDGYAIPIACVENGLTSENIEKLQSRVETDIFGGSFIFHTVFAEMVLVHLPDDLEPNLFEKLKKLRKGVLTNFKLRPHYIPHGTYNPDDVLLQKISWKVIRNVARRTRTHTEYCATDPNFTCVADEIISDEEEPSWPTATQGPSSTTPLPSNIKSIGSSSMSSGSETAIERMAIGGTRHKGSGQAWREEEIKYLAYLVDSGRAEEHVISEFMKQFPSRTKHGIKLKLKLNKKQQDKAIGRATIQ